VAQDHGDQFVRLAPNDEGSGARHASAWRRVGGDGRLNGRTATAAASGGYAISKGALLTATRVLGFELGAAGIRVNAVVPGWMMGPAVEIYVQMTSAARNISEEAVLAELTERIPVGHIPTDDEVAGTIVYLASDLSASLTGQAIDANGGEVFD